MRRRSLLVALAGGLSGCSGIGGVSGLDGRDRDPYEVPDRTDEGDGDGGDVDRVVGPPTEGVARAVQAGVGSPRQLAVAGPPATRAPPGGRLVAGLRHPPDRDHPARLRIAVGNAGDRPRTFEFGPTPPFSNYAARRPDDFGRRYLLVPVDGRSFPYGDLVPDAPTDGQWVATDELGTPEGDLTTPEVTLAPGEFVAGDYALLRHPDAGGRPERGAFVFDVLWEETTLVVSVWRPTDAVGESSLSRSVPSLPGRTTRWYHEFAADARNDPGGDGVAPRPAYLRPSRERLSLPADQTDLTVVNDSLGTVRVDGWTLYKRQNGTWWRVTPWPALPGSRDPPATTPPGELSPTAVPPGTTRELSLHVDGSRVPTGGRRSPAGTTWPVVPGLGGGLYGVRYGRARPEVSATEPVVAGGDRVERDGRGAVGLGALFELAGDPVTVTRTRTVESVEREGSTAVVRVDSRIDVGDDGAAGNVSDGSGDGNAGDGPDDAGDGGDGGDGGGDRDGGPELVVTRDPERPERRPPRPLIAEQVLRFSALRNAVATFAPGVDTVRVRTRSYRVRRPVGVLGTDGRLPLVFRGERYDAVARGLDPARE